MSAAPSRCIVVGVGNTERGDDAAGRAVAERLRDMLPAQIAVTEGDGEVTALLESLNGATSAFLVDASASGATPGSVRRFDVSEAPLPQGMFSLSTHGLGLPEAIELARALGQLPAHCVVYAIEGDSFEVGAALSPAVERAVGMVAERLRAEIGDAEETRSSG